MTIFAEGVSELFDQILAMQEEWNKVGRAEEVEADLAQTLATALEHAQPLQKIAAEKSPREFIEWCFTKCGFKLEDIPNPEDINSSTVLARCFLQKISAFFMTVHQRAATSAQMAFMLPEDKKKQLEDQKKALEEMRIASKEEYDKRAEEGKAKTVKFPETTVSPETVEENPDEEEE